MERSAETEIKLKSGGGTTTPRVMILTDTSVVSGPAKGLLQLIRNLDKTSWYHLLCTFQYESEHETQFARAARAAGGNFEFLPQGLVVDPSPIFKAVSLARKNSINLVQSHGYKTHLVALILSRVLGIPWIGVTHGWTYENWKMRLYRSFETWILKFARVAVTVSSQLQREISQSRGADRPTLLLLNAVDPVEIQGEIGGVAIRKQLGFTDGDFVIGTFGRLSQEKGQDLALKALADLQSRGVAAKLLIVGDGPNSQALAELSRDLGIEKQVVFVPHTQAIRDYFEAINLYLLPSLSEGLPNVILEAATFALPVVATDVGAVREVIDDRFTGLIVEPGSAKLLAQALDWALSHRQEMKEMGERLAQSLFPKFSATARAQRFLALYRECLGAK